MKRISLLAIAALVTTIAAAQIQFGVKGGLNLANLHVSPKDETTDFKLKTDFHAGALVYIPLFSNFGLQAEALYSGQGTKVDADGSTFKYNLGYVNIPVFFKYKDPSGLFAEIGPQVGFQVIAKAKANGATSDLKDSFKKVDVAGVVGIGYLSPFNLGIDARYNLGLTNILKESDNGSVKNRVIQVGLFYVFGGNKK